jgi:Icc-related predicted phosphoesterase/uncharacterized protein YprB with RNaseH-like and TPR domain
MPHNRNRASRQAVDRTCRLKFDSDVLQIVAFSDYRVQDISLLLDFVKQLRPKPNLILYAGDDVKEFHRGSDNYFEQLAALSTHGLCPVLGNDDTPKGERGNDIRGANVYNVHKTTLIIGKYAVIGSEGSPPDKENPELRGVIYKESRIAQHLQRVAESARGKQLVLVSHCPPLGVLDLAIRFSKDGLPRPIGSDALRKFLLRRKTVPLVVCGHAHRCGGQSIKLKGSTVVNAASHDNRGAPGKVAWIEIRAGKVRDVGWKHLWELESVPGIKKGHAAQLRNAGIGSVAQLGDTTADIKKILDCGAGEALTIKRRASALHRQKPLLFKPFEIPDGKRAYIDIETDRSNRYIWLVGLLIDGERKPHQFFADTPEDEKDILTKLLQVLDNGSELRLLSYSQNKFEQRLLPERFIAHSLPAVAVSGILDIYNDIGACAAFPALSTKLKDISRSCGFKARHPGMSGLDAANHYESSYGSGKPDKLVKQRLLDYNKDDIFSLKHVVDYIESHAPADHAADGEAQLALEF